MWFVFALLSAVFAALTSVLAKVGIEGVNSNLATALRTCVVLAMAWLMVFITHTQSGIGSIGRKSWVFLILSGLATGASWLCYYKAIQMGSVMAANNVVDATQVFKGRPHRQAQRCHHPYPCSDISPRGLHSKISHRCGAYHCRHSINGTIRRTP